MATFRISQFGMGGIYYAHCTLGFPVADSLQISMRKNIAVDWVDFFRAAKQDGKTLDQVKQMIKSAIVDSGYPMTCNEVVARAWESAFDQLIA